MNFDKVPIVEIIKFSKNYSIYLFINNYHYQSMLVIQNNFVKKCIETFVPEIYNYDIIYKLINNIDNPNKSILSIKELKLLSNKNFNKDELSIWKVNSNSVLDSLNIFDEDIPCISINYLRYANNLYNINNLKEDFNLIEVITAIYAGIEILMYEIKNKIYKNENLSNVNDYNIIDDILYSSEDDSLLNDTNNSLYIDELNLSDIIKIDI